MKSIKERSVTDEEMGMFWRDLELSWWWFRAPIETQAMMIEAFDEVTNDQTAVEDCKVWLLKQKQTPGLEDDQGHRRRGLRAAAPRRQPAEVGCAGAK